MTIRTFIALEIPLIAIDKIIKILDDNAGKEYKWEPINKLHITLKFIGDIESNLIEPISEELQILVEKSKNFNLLFRNFGMFYRDKKPKIFWLGLVENENLSNFTVQIDNICAKFGLEKEKRKFLPHITLLRIKEKDNTTPLEKLLKFDLPEIKFSADKVTIFKSELLPTGSVYKPLRSFYIKN